MLVKTLPVGHLETNCYVAADEATLKCVIIDPGDEFNTIMDYVEELRLSPEAIFLTHGHYDHTGAVEDLVEELDIPVYIHRADFAGEDEPFSDYKYSGSPETRFYDEGDKLTIGNLTFTVMATPGHSPGSVVLQCGDCLFSGDTLFRGSYGRTDLPGGSLPQMIASLRRLYALEGDPEVYPGHMEFTSLHRERNANPYMRAAVGIKE